MSTVRSALTVTVVVCTHNRPLTLERCLKALQKMDYAKFDVIVVDNAPTSNEAQILASRYRVDYCVAAAKGLSRARNAGSRSCSSDFIAYLDDDMVPHAGWLRALMDGFTDENVMAVTGPILPLEVRKSSELELRALLEKVPWGPLRFHIDRSSSRWFDRANFGGIGDGNFALRRSAFTQLAGFDERLGRGVAVSSGEEHYAYFRLVSMGAKVVYAPWGIVFHPSSPLSKEHRRKVIAEAVAYAAFLVCRHPRQSWRVAKYFAAGALGGGRWWRKPPEQGVGPLSLREKTSAVLDGLFTYWHSLWARCAPTDISPHIVEKTSLTMSPPAPADTRSVLAGRRTGTKAVT
jgi:O-antigen biosynthesis protein